MSRRIVRFSSVLIISHAALLAGIAQADDNARQGQGWLPDFYAMSQMMEQAQSTERNRIDPIGRVIHDTHFEARALSDDDVTLTGTP